MALGPGAGHVVRRSARSSYPSSKAYEMPATNERSVLLAAGLSQASNRLQEISEHNPSRVESALLTDGALQEKFHVSESALRRHTPGLLGNRSLCHHRRLAPLGVRAPDSIPALPRGDEVVDRQRWTGGLTKVRDKVGIPTGP